MEIRSRKEALAAGAKFYFTGKPCSKGHVCERYADGGDKGRCRQCAKERVKRALGRYRARHKAKIAADSAAHYQANKAERNAAAAAWRKANPERTRAFTAKWQEVNREEYRKIGREWGQNNKDKMRAQRARRRGSEGFHSEADVLEILKLQRGRCAMPSCRKKLGKYEVDHIVPINGGGSNWRQNIQLLCPRCNASKGARDPLDHSRMLGFLL
jgi:5-methylcytosine-specific restriction endonuclease McrA